MKGNEEAGLRGGKGLAQGRLDSLGCQRGQ